MSYYTPYLPSHQCPTKTVSQNLIINDICIRIVRESSIIAIYILNISHYDLYRLSAPDARVTCLASFVYTHIAHMAIIRFPSPITYLMVFAWTHQHRDQSLSLTLSMSIHSIAQSKITCCIRTSHSVGRSPLPIISF